MSRSDSQPVRYQLTDLAWELYEPIPYEPVDYDASEAAALLRGSDTMSYDNPEAPC